MNSLRHCTERLIRINSVTRGEAEIADYVEGELQGFGLKTRRFQNNVIAGSGPILLAGHLDTVPPANSSQLIPRFKKGSLYGRGACDVKGGLAIMLQLAREGVPAQYVFYSGEEGPLPNGLDVLHKGGALKAKAAIALEPTGLELYTSCRGRLLSKTVFAGKSGHSGLSGNSGNAVYSAFEAVGAVFSAAAAAERRGESLAVTRVESEGPTNAVPSDCTVFVDYRFSPGKSLAEAKKLITKLFGSKTMFLDESPAYSLPPAQARLFSRHFGRGSTFPAWSDAAQLTNWGIPCAVYGPGNLELAHSEGESVALAELGRAYLSLKAFIRNSSTSFAVS